MKIFAQIIGITAVCFYFLGYLQKKRKSIILFNVTSRILYVLQYFLLGAFEGAILDIMGTVSSLLAGKKDASFIKKHLRAVMIISNLLIVAAGVVTMLLSDNVSILSTFPIVGVLLHTGAFWISHEKTIRRISFLGSPFWLIYNFAVGAYGSCIGDILSMVSIGISMYRYDRKTKPITD